MMVKDHFINVDKESHSNYKDSSYTEKVDRKCQICKWWVIED